MATGADQHRGDQAVPELQAWHRSAATIHDVTNPIVYKVVGAIEAAPGAAG